MGSFEDRVGRVISEDNARQSQERSQEVAAAAKDRARQREFQLFMERGVLAKDVWPDKEGVVRDFLDYMAVRGYPSPDITESVPGYLVGILEKASTLGRVFHEIETSDGEITSGWNYYVHNPAHRSIVKTDIKWLRRVHLGVDGTLRVAIARDRDRFPGEYTGMAKLVHTQYTEYTESGAAAYGDDRDGPDMLIHSGGIIEVRTREYSCEEYTTKTQEYFRSVSLDELLPLIAAKKAG